MHTYICVQPPIQICLPSISLLTSSVYLARTDLKGELVLRQGVQSRTYLLLVLGLAGQGRVESGSQSGRAEGDAEGGVQRGRRERRGQLIVQLLLQLRVELSKSLLTAQGEGLVEVLLLAKDLLQRAEGAFKVNVDHSNGLSTVSLKLAFYCGDGMQCLSNNLSM